MLKVLEVSSDSNIGGAGKCILTFLKTFDRSRFSVGAVLPKDSLLKPEIAALDIPVYEMENLAEKSLDFRAVRALRRLFQKLKPDVVHTHASMSARFAAFSLGIPVVYTRHSVFPPPAALTRFPGKQINGLVNNLTASKIIAVAEAAKDNLTDTGVSAKKIEDNLNGVAALTEVSAEEFGRLRAEYLPENAVSQTGTNLTFLAGQAKLFRGADFLLAAETKPFRGIELLGNIDAAPGILRALDEKEGVFSTIGSETPFAMYHALQPGPEPTYFGLAFD